MSTSDKKKTRRFIWFVKVIRGFTNYFEDSIDDISDDTISSAQKTEIVEGLITIFSTLIGLVVTVGSLIWAMFVFLLPPIKDISKKTEQTDVEKRETLSEQISESCGVPTQTPKQGVEPHVQETE
jgi:hypothetical protein